MASILGTLRSFLARIAPHWHPSRHSWVRLVIANWVAWRRPSVIPTRHGFDLYVPPEDRSPITVGLYLEGEYEAEETRFVQDFVGPGQVAVDVGANVGYVTCLMAQAVGVEGAVHAFEPEERHFAALRRNVEQNGFFQVTLRRQALSSSAGTAYLHLDPENPGDHTLVPLAGRRTVPVSTGPFDAYWKDTGEVRPIRLVKIDVQGHEVNVVQGMMGTLRSGAVEAVLLEVWPARLRQAGRSDEELLAPFCDLGWQARVLSSTGRYRPESLREVLAVTRRAEGDPHLSFNLVLRPEVG